VVLAAAGVWAIAVPANRIAGTANRRVRITPIMDE
jgi:hypothetical protein